MKNRPELGNLVKTSRAEAWQVKSSVHLTNNSSLVCAVCESNRARNMNSHGGVEFGTCQNCGRSLAFSVNRQQDTWEFADIK